MENVTILIKKGGDKALAESFSNKINSPILDKEGDELTVVFDSKGVSLAGYGLTYQGDFEESMQRRVTDGRLYHEMLCKATKVDSKSPNNLKPNTAPSSKLSKLPSANGLKAIDATAGMGEDAFIIAANGYDVTLHEQNPVIALLLKDAIRRAKKQPSLKDIASRMTVVEGNSIEILSNRLDPVDVIYLDPMFPGRQKSSLINKKLQLIQKMESPCSEEHELFDAAIKANPSKIIVKRPLKAPWLAERKPTYSLDGKAIRYDCYIY